MNYVVLDDFPSWSVYVPAVVILAVFLLSLSMLLAAIRTGPAHSTNQRTNSRSKRPFLIFTIASAFALWFLVSSMFFDFHAVGIDRTRVELVYLWPRPSAMIDSSEIVEVKLARAGRSCGHLEIATREELYRSVNFRKCDNAETVIKQIPLRR